MKVLVIDVGGSHVKVLATGHREPRRFDSGPRLKPAAMVKKVKQLTKDWSYDVLSVGYPGMVVNGKIAREPANLGAGWRRFDFQKAFGVPVRLINDAAMQALGDYRSGSLLFLGLGTGLGSAMVFDGRVVPMELAHLPYRRHRSYEDYLGAAGLKRLGKKKWRKHVFAVVGLLRAALAPDTVVLGGGNARKVGALPPGTLLGQNARAFVGGFRLWK